jgi:hypothetical protein
MFTLSIDSNNDLYLNDSNNIDTRDKINAIVQNCQTAVQMLLKEAIYFQNDGTPAFQTIWDGSPNYSQAEASIRSIILKVNGVVNIISFTYVANNNIFSYNINIETIYGTTFLQGNLNV